MSTSKVDAKKRIVLPNAQQGDVFDIQEQAEGRYTLVRLERPTPSERLTRAESLAAIDGAPLQQSMDWETLRKATRSF